MFSAKWIYTCLYIVVLYYTLFPNLAHATTTTNYCDCTANYTSSLPNGSHCPNGTEWDSWTLNCTVLPANSTNGTGNATSNSTVVLKEVDLSLYNYTTYNATLYPLNETCTCDCNSTTNSTSNSTTYNFWVWGNGTNQTSISIDKDIAQDLDGGVKTVNTTTTTTTTIVNNAVTEVVVNVTFTMDVTSSGTTTRKILTTNITTNITGDATGRALAWGVCYPDVPDTGLKCHNCLFIPRMDNFTICVDEQESCPYKCTKIVYQNLGVDYYVSACYNDSARLVCGTDTDCKVELCATDYCNNWVPMGATQHTVNLILLVTMVLAALLGHLQNPNTS